MFFFFNQLSYDCRLNEEVKLRDSISTFNIRDFLRLVNALIQIDHSITNRTHQKCSDAFLVVVILVVRSPFASP